MTQPHGTDSKKLTPIPITGREHIDTPVRLRVTTPSKPPPPPVADRYEVLRLVVDQSYPLSLAGDKMGVSSKVIGRIVQGALRRGEIEHAGRGKYERVQREEKQQMAAVTESQNATTAVRGPGEQPSYSLRMLGDGDNPFATWASYKSQQGRRGEEVLRIGKGIEVSVAATRRYLAPLGKEVGVDVRADGGRMALLFGAPRPGLLGAATHKTMRVGGPALVAWLEENGVARGRYRIEWDEGRRAMVAGERIG